jgi:hypothetical protein
MWPKPKTSRTGPISMEIAPNVDLHTRLMFGAAKRDVAFWLDLERALDQGLDLGFLPDDVMQEHERAERIAREFCLAWSEWSNDQTRPRFERMENELKDVGAAAAPYLFDVLGQTPYFAFGNMDPVRGATARMQVRALFAVGLLEMKEAVPFLIYQCRGPSLTATSTAATVLQKLTGEEFEAKWLQTVDLSTIDWWAKETKQNPVGLDALVERVIRDMRAQVARDPVWWSENARLVERDLGALLNTSFPELHSKDPAKQRKQIDRIEEWWKKHHG